MKNWINLKSSIIDKKLCTSCGTCIGMCPTNAITFEDGKIIGDIKKCINCGLCIDNCIGDGFDYKYFNKLVFNADLEEINLDIGYYKKIYSGYSTTPNIRKNASSGGIVTEILIGLMEKGVIDGAVTISQNAKIPYKFEVKIAKSIDEIINSSQSKYVIVPTNEIIKEITKLEGRYAFVGLPCQIQGMRKLTEKRNDIGSKIFVYIGLFCGFNIEFGGTQFLLDKLGIRNEDICKLEYRAKEETTGLRIKTNKEKIFLDKHSYNFINVLYSPKRCWKCYDLTSEFADISVGDAWEKGNLGWSRVITRTDKGEEIIQNLFKDRRIYIENSCEEDIYSTQKQLIDYKKKWFWIRKQLMKNFPSYNIDTIKLNNKDKIKAYVFYLILLLGKTNIVRILVKLVPFNLVGKLSKGTRNFLKGVRNEK